MARYFNYIPFPRVYAGDYASGSWRLGWSHGDKQFQDVYYDDLGKPLKDLGNDCNVNIYVRGHGSAGSDEICNYESFGESHQISTQVNVKDVVADLISKGIDKTFCGKIKLYNCYSADAGQSGEAIAFAARVAATFRERGYDRAWFFGYSGAILAKRQGRPDAVKRANEFATEINDALAERDEHQRCGLPLHPNKFLDLLAKGKDVHKWTCIQGTWVRTKTLKKQF